MLLQNLVQERWPGAGLVGRLALMALPTRGPGLRPWLPRATRGHQHQPAPGCCRARGPELRAASRHQQPSPSAVCAPGPLRAGGLLLDQLSAQLIQDTTRTAKCRWRKAGFGKCRPDQCQNHYLVRQELSNLIHNEDHIHIMDPYLGLYLNRRFKVFSLWCKDWELILPLSCFRGVEESL